MRKRKAKQITNRRGPTPSPVVASGARRSILAFLKRHRGGLVAEIATHLRIGYEGARQHLTQLEKENLVEKQVLRPSQASAGRPHARYVLSHAADHLFPKNYDELTVDLIDAVTARLGVPALTQVLGALTDARVHDWAPRLERKPLKERVKALEEIYADGDPYMSTEIGRDGIRLIEHNCPFFNVASQRPALCSVTVSALQRLLGVKVVREERFQTGHGRCVFRVLANQPINARRFRFELESEIPVK